MRILEDKGIRYVPRPQANKQFTCEGVAQDLDVPVAWVVKAMVAQTSDGSFALAVLRGDRQLSLKKLGSLLGDKNVSMAQARDVQRVTGYQVGAVSVLGFRRPNVPAYLDRDVLTLERVIISSGRPDLGLELSPQDLQRAMQAQVDDLSS